MFSDWLISDGLCSIPTPTVAFIKSTEIVREASEELHLQAKATLEGEGTFSHAVVCNRGSKVWDYRIYRHCPSSVILEGHNVSEIPLCPQMCHLCTLYTSLPPGYVYCGGAILSRFVGAGKGYIGVLTVLG
jgi:hypothetical protein